MRIGDWGLRIGDWGLRIEDLRFKEIEHKYVVGEDFNLDAFRAALNALNPVRHATLHVRDRYFITEAGRALGISTTTAHRGWTFARAWLHEAIRGIEPESNDA